MGSGDVRVEVVVEDDALAPRGRTTVLSLSWRRADPLAVLLAVTARPDHPALPHGEWMVLRDFLRYGLEEPTGDGDVRIAPLGSTVRFRLRKEGRPCEISVPRGTVCDFLDATEAIVPAGEERSDEALDELIRRLLET